MEAKETRVGNINNYYGGLYVKQEENKYFWCIKCGFNIDKWEEISESLYLELLKMKHNDLFG